jgi:hypothetical protein
MRKRNTKRTNKLTTGRARSSSSAKVFSSSRSAIASGPFAGLKKMPTIAIPKSKKVSGYSTKGRKLTTAQRRSALSYSAPRTQLFSGGSPMVDFMASYPKRRKVS